MFDVIILTWLTLFLFSSRLSKDTNSPFQPKGNCVQPVCLEWDEHNLKLEEKMHEEDHLVIGCNHGPVSLAIKLVF